MRLLEIEQGTQEWLDMRRRCIGASDSPVIMGVSPWKTPYQLWREKIFGEDQLDNAAMARGRSLESEAREAVEELTGKRFKPAVAAHDTSPYLIASFDGLSESGQVLEIKCPGAKDHEIAVSGKIPEHYYPQLQHQILVAGSRVAIYASYRDGDLQLITVQADSGYINNLTKANEQFYRCMITLEQPELCDRDYIERHDLEFIRAVSQWKEARANAKDAVEKEELYKNELLAICGGKNTKGSGISLTQITRAGAIDYKQIPELQGVDLNPYRKEPSSFWRVCNGK